MKQGEVWTGRREGGRRGGGASRMQGRARLEVGARARTINISSMLVTLDVTKFSGLLNLFAFCRVAGRGIRSGATCRPRGERAVGGVRCWRHAGKGPGGGWARAGTLNMPSMFVTPEVSQLEMSSLILSSPEKTQLMSVMPETFQVTIRPYLTLAAVLSSSYSPTAVFSSALLVKTKGSSERRRPLVGGTGVLARSTGSHCGGHATGWLASASLLGTQGFVVCGMKAKVAATQMRTSAQELDVCFFAYKLRSGGLDAWQVHGMGAWWEEGCGWEVDGRWMVAPLPLHLRDALRAAERHVVHLLVTGLHIRSGLGQNLPRLAQVRLCVRTGMAGPSL